MILNNKKVKQNSVSQKKDSVKTGVKNSFSSLNPEQPYSGSPDYMIFIIYLALVFFSIVLVYGSSYNFSLKIAKNPYYLFYRHIIGVILGFSSFLVGYLISLKFVRKLNMLISLITVGTLLTPLIPGIGTTIAGTRRWLSIGGITFQPSEIAKMLIVFYLAYQLTRFKKEIEEPRLTKHMLLIFTFSGICGLLILLQKDFSTTLLFFSTIFLLLYISGFNTKILFYTVILVILALIPFVLLTPYRLERIDMLLNFSSNPQNAYQIYQSVNAFHRGGLFGLGPGDGKQSIPYIFNDFIFAASGEEFGFIGSSLIIILYFLLLKRGWKIARGLEEISLYESLIALGFTFNIVFQAFANMAVNMAIIFPTGIPLPLISYGRTSFIVSSFCIGMLLKLSKKVT